MTPSKVAIQQLDRKLTLQTLLKKDLTYGSTWLNIAEIELRAKRKIAEDAPHFCT
jgi:hypothetical protein